MQSVLSDIQYHSEEAAYAYVEARLWPEGPICPHCGNADGKHIGKLNWSSNPDRSQVLCLPAAV